MSKKIFIKTYGCQMNVYDSIKMQELMEPLNFQVTEDMNLADLVIINTCHIREKAAEKMYSELGRVRNIKEYKAKIENIKMLIVVAGCVGQAEGEEIFARAPFVDIVVGPQSYHTLPNLVAQAFRDKKHLIALDFVENEKFDNLAVNTAKQGASAFVSVQEGCDKFCTFCVVPYTRGAEFSRDVSSIYRECISLAGKNSKEVYLLGQNVNAYHGKAIDNREYSLAELIKHISSIKDIERIRYTTSHPRDMSDDLIQAHAVERKLMPFLHLPVQSGSNRILAAMNRGHSREYYFDIINKLRDARNDMVFSSDFIVGFPGETEEDFQDTLDLVKQIGYGQCFSFKYSPRPGTPAAVKDQVPEHEKDRRLQILQKELSKQQLSTNRSMIHKILPVLFEKKGKFDKQIIGKSPYLQSVYVTGEEHLIGQIYDVQITDAFQNSLQGEIVG